MKVALTIRSFGGYDSEARGLLNDSGLEIWENLSGRHLNKEELGDAVKDADGVIAGTEKFDRDVLKAMHRAKIISRVGVGTDNIDIKAAEEYGILVKNTPLSPSRAVAEHTFALIFALYRNVKEHVKNMEKKQFKVLTGTLLSGKVLGICGLGNVGKNVAQMGLALGCKILFYDPQCKEDENRDLCCMGSLQDIFSRADIVTLHACPSKETEKMINREVLRFAKKGLVFINTARGNMVDESALLEYLENGRLAGVGLDVFQSEPYYGPLAAHTKVIATPHVSSNTVETRKAMELEAVKNLFHGLRIKGVR